ncbi:FecCD family ABC transporter permease [Treponema pedis]|nr:iron ABC transporter permease [Treponema pedis]
MDRLRLKKEYRDTVPHRVPHCAAHKLPHPAAHKEPCKAANEAPVQKRQRLSAASFMLLIGVLTVVLLLSIVFSVCTGIAGGNIETFAHAIMYPARASGIGKIMMDMRMPRALTACITGAAFALSGAAMQGLTRNPLADAGLLGINAGAGFFVALTAVFLPAAPKIVTIVSAFAGAAFAATLVYEFGVGKRKTESFRLILAGAAVSALLTALSQAVSLAFGITKAMSFWSAGSLSGVTWQSLHLIAPFIITAGGIAMLLSGYLSVLALGEDSAAGLGINVRAVRLICIFAVLLLAGASVSLVGGISFLGLIVPHISRFFVGGDYKRILPISALLGGIILVIADVAARTVNAPFDTPVGALVSIIGVPVFFALTYRKGVHTL